MESVPCVQRGRHRIHPDDLGKDPLIEMRLMPCASLLESTITKSNMYDVLTVSQQSQPSTLNWVDTISNSKIRIRDYVDSIFFF